MDRSEDADVGKRWHFATAVLVLAGLLLSLLGGCGGDAATSDTTESTIERNAQATTQAAADADEPVTLKATRPQPVIEPKSGKPPAQLVITDLREGDGKVARVGDEIVINTYAVRYSNGEEWIDSWTGDGKTLPKEFVLGDGWEIPGLEKGLRGMRAGGRRELIVPPKMIFSNSGPEDTMIYVVDLVKVS